MVVDGSWWHQGPVGRPLVYCPAVSRGPGRYHRAAGPGVWYASSSMRSSWCELFRHFPDDGALDPFEVRRRAGRAQASSLRVLDLTDAVIRNSLGVDEAALTGDDYTLCQDLADAARAAELDGLLAPSAGLPGQRTLAVFFTAIDGGRITEETGRVQVPPLDLVHHLHHVRPVPSSAAAYAAYLASLGRSSYAALRQRYRRR